MLDPATHDFLAAAKGRRQVELSARFTDALTRPSKPDPRAEAVRDQVWAELGAAILAAVGEYEGDGLRVLRHLKTRPEMILTGPVATWRRFFDEKRTLAGGRSVVFSHYVRPWSHGLPGFPE